MDSQKNENPTTPSPGERSAPATPPHGLPVIPLDAPPPQPPPSPPSPPTGSYPAQTTSQPAWPPYPQGGQESYPQQQQQPQSYPPPQPPPTQGHHAQGGYMPGAPPPGTQGGYYQPDYRPTSQGGYSTHEQPTQAYGQGQGQGQGGYPGYPAYPPQQGGSHQYNVNAPKKGTPAWVWGVIGAVLLALIGGGLLYFLVLSPRSNTVAGNSTPQPTAAAGQPTTVPTTPPTVGRNTPVPPTAVRPTSITQPTTVPTTSVSPPTTVPGQGGFVGTPRDATVAFLGYLREEDYASAHTLLAPEMAGVVDVNSLEIIWQLVRLSTTGDIEVGEASESGDTAEVAVTIRAISGGSEQAKIPLVKEEGKWYILDPFALNGISPGGFPTFEPFEIPTLSP